LTASGKIFTGLQRRKCLVRPTNCAERTAFLPPLLREMERPEETMTGGDGCGDARRTFAVRRVSPGAGGNSPPELPILLVDSDRQLPRIGVHETDMKTLLPGRFILKS